MYCSSAADRYAPCGGKKIGVSSDNNRLCPCQETPVQFARLLQQFLFPPVEFEVFSHQSVGLKNVVPENLRHRGELVGGFVSTFNDPVDLFR